MGPSAVSQVVEQIVPIAFTSCRSLYRYKLFKWKYRNSSKRGDLSEHFVGAIGSGGFILVLV